MAAPLYETPEFHELLDALQKPRGAALATGCVSSQKLHLTDALSRDAGLAPHAKYRLIVTWSDQRARQLRDEYAFYDRGAVLFPAKDLIFYQADLRGGEIQRERMRCLRRLLEGRPCAVVTTYVALMTPQVPAQVLRAGVLELEKRQIVERKALAAKLISMGYRRTAQTEVPGEFSVRGDIMDIFDATQDNPVRIEFWDDEVDSIRSYDAESQRSVLKMETIRIYPATELILTDDLLEEGLRRIAAESGERVRILREGMRAEAAHRLEVQTQALLEEVRELHIYDRLEGYLHYFYPETDTFADMFPAEQTLIVLDEPERLRAEADAVEKEFRESCISRSKKGYILPGQMRLLRSGDETAARLERFRRLGLREFADDAGLLREQGRRGAADAAGSAGAAKGAGRGEEASPAGKENADGRYYAPECTVSMHARRAGSYNRSFAALTEDLKRYQRQSGRAVIVSGSRTRAKRLASDLTSEGVSAFYSENPERVLQAGEVMTCYGNIAQGFEYPQLKFTVIAETDIFGARRAGKKKTHRYEGESIRDFASLRVGDYVVHEDHGIGIYRGVETIEVEGIAKDYLKIEYGGGGTLYVLPTELKVLQRYSAEGTAKPKLNRLGTQEWSASKAKVRRAVDEVAQDLVELYAKRRAMKGHAFAKDTVWQKEFEELFPFEETQDQLTAIGETKRDMESEKIMDRLICGDVGFGKTEIAIRAAFKAVQDGMQVAVLVPTTILAQQHFNTFTERMKGYPVNVAQLSRFNSQAEMKKTIEGLSSGRVDIVIGTHRLLSKDVRFKNLGLLVVDEEQRFGVSHKEKIKKLRGNVDVLTLTATPIPRTLHMSLIGIRDMSLLEEAPLDRTSVQTYVMEYDAEMVREAVLRELSRGGQVYYVYNRVNDIDLVSAQLRELLPEARISSAHGQMNEARLERVMYDFIAGDIDVLVSTTIIETGLDIPNVNTIIIHDSERMGLSQLYQLRGRVGRSNRTAYAFLMYRKDRMLKETAEKRLMAIREFTELGSGYRIAMRDLEIRGAGNLLGRAQHGHMAAVGYDMYCALLDEAVKKAKGEEIVPEKTTEVALSADAYIPDSYILNESQKLDVYKKIAAISSVDDCEDIRDELRDRFGEKIPAPAQNLLRIALIRSVAARIDIAQITGGDGRIRIVMSRDAGIRVENIPRLLAARKGTLSFMAKGLARGDYKGQPFFELKYPVKGISVSDEETLLTETEMLLTQISEMLR